MAPARHADTECRFENLLSEQLLQAAYGYALNLTRNGADAEDLLQEASLRAFRFFDSFEAGTNFKAWYFRILTNCYYQAGRQVQRRVKTVEFDEAPRLHMFAAAAAAGLYATHDDPASELMARLDAAHIQDAIEALPEEYRVVSILYFMEDFSYAEIAGMIECPIGTVRSRLHRGRKLLQKSLWAAAVDRGIVRELNEQVAQA